LADKKDMKGVLVTIRVNSRRKKRTRKKNSVFQKKKGLLWIRWGKGQ